MQRHLDAVLRIVGTHPVEWFGLKSGYESLKADGQSQTTHAPRRSARSLTDDILFVVPADAMAPDVLERTVSDEIVLQGNGMSIATAKTAVHRFTRHGTELRCVSVRADAPNKHFEYLGFRFDGRHVRLRDSTLSNLRGKIAKAVRRGAISQSRRYRSWTVDEICERYDFRGVYERFGRVRNFEDVQDPTDWTFWTYVKRIEEVMGSDARPIPRQLRNQKAQIRKAFRGYVEQDRA